MPLVLSRPDDAAKIEYLRGLFTEVYIKDIVERKKITRPEILSAIVDFLASSISSLTYVSNVANAIHTRQKLSKGRQVSNNTVSSYIDHLEDAFLFHECTRYDVRGKSYFDYPNKYYCEDVSVVFESSHDAKGNSKRIARETDFIVTMGGQRLISSQLTRWILKKRSIQKLSLSLSQGTLSPK